MNVEASEGMDAVAFEVLAGYAVAHCPAFLIRALQTGNVRIMGPSLPVDLVVKMLRQAADQLEAGAVLGRVMN